MNEPLTDYVSKILLSLLGASAEALADSGFTMAQFRTLLVLSHYGPVRQQRIADAVDRDKQTMTGMVSQLYSWGLVERRDHPTDRRANVIVLTPVGQSVLMTLLTRSAELFIKTLDSLPEMARNLTYEALSTLLPLEEITNTTP